MANEINIGGIKIVFGADTKPLEDGGRRVEQTLDRAEMAANGLRAALGWMATFVGFAAIAGQIGDAVGRLENMAKMSRQVDRALEITGNTAQTTSTELQNYAEALEASTGRAAEEIMSLGANLASYGFTHEVFYRSIDLANDMSTAWGGDLRQNLEGLARALDDPIKGFAILSKRGIKLTQDQKDLVQELINANDHLGAQGVVFEALEAQVSGVAEAGFDGLTKAMATASEASETFFETLVQAVDLPERLEDGLNTATQALGYLADNMDVIVGTAGGAATALGVVLLPAILSTTVAWGALAVAMLTNPMVQLAVVAGTLAGALIYLSQQQQLAAQTAAEHERAVGENANAIEIAKTSSEGFRNRLREQIAMQLDAAAAALAEARAQREAAAAKASLAEGFAGAMQGASQLLFGEGDDRSNEYVRNIYDPIDAAITAAEGRITDLKTQLGDLDTVIATIPPGADPVYTGSGQADTSADVKAAKAAEQAEKRLEVLRTSLLTEEEAELESYERKLAALEEFYAAKDITEQQFMDMRERLTSQHEEKLTDIVRQQQELRNRLMSETISRVTSTLDAISGVLQQSGEEQFGIVKALSIASALIKGYEAITSSYAAGAAIGGPPVGIAFAALAAAQTAAQISQLMSVTSSSKGTPTAGGGGSAQMNTTPEAATQGITIQGFDRNMLVTGDAIYDLIDRINEAQRDGKKVQVLG